MFKVFQRLVWIKDPSYPDGYSPLAISVDDCRTIYKADTEDEARNICKAGNRKWYKHLQSVYDGSASAKQREVYYTTPRYEYTEV
jgi:hypothetical protein